MTQPIPAAPCLVPPSATPPDDEHRRGAIYGVLLAADHLDAQATESAARARALRLAAEEHETIARTLREQSATLRRRAGRLGAP